MKSFILLITACLVLSPVLQGQSDPLDSGIYNDFLIATRDISPGGLYQLYPSPVFKASVPEFDFETVLYWEKMKSAFNITEDEKAILKNNGFMVTERIHKGSFYSQFFDIYKKDLPVFVSTDAILHAFHLSYDKILKQVETSYLIPQLKEILMNAHSKIPVLEDKYGQEEEMKPMLSDVDVYLAVCLRLLGFPGEPIYPENDSIINEYLSLIAAEQVDSVSFFSEEMIRIIDFSQFKPRGHYEESRGNLPEYFRTMMWLGRMELYLDHPDYYAEEAVRTTVNRQIVDAFLIHELLDMDSNREIFEEMEDIISFFVGEQDNVSPIGMEQLLEECKLRSASELLDESNINCFLDSLRNKPFAGQQILSQVFNGNKDGTSRPLPSAFMLFGQRFIIDSYVTGQVVYDRINYNGANPCRLVPSTLDIMFALGNDAALQLLIPELQKFHYSDKLAELRFLIDHYGEEFWESSLYNLWLYAIKSLKPDPGNKDLPEFMKTSAWGLEKLNSQLSSWAELRHDNLLYAKQSYTSSIICSHPKGYVEPNPEFFGRMKRLAEIAGNKFATMDVQVYKNLTDNPENYFTKLFEICHTLQNIANKELLAEELSEDECRFLDNITYEGFGGCAGPIPTGWYLDLIFEDQEPEEINLVVADYHTTPTDCGGGSLGWVSHAGTGLPDMSIVVAPLANGELCAFSGPVASYHEYKTSNFVRLTDSVWVREYLDLSFRPDWVYNYLADVRGGKQNSEMKYFSDRNELYELLNIPFTSFQDNEIQKDKSIIISPNPINRKALITLKIPDSSHGIHAKIAIYDLSGRVISILIDGPLPSGYFVTEWNSSDQSGNLVPSGSYILSWEQGETRLVEQLIVIK